MDKLTNEMIVALANDLGLEPALLKAVQLVEGAGRDGFLVDGRPQILFEGHIMYKEIKNKFGLDKAVAAQKSYPTIVSRNGINLSILEELMSTKDSKLLRKLMKNVL